jgi:ferrous-iron efflux pump FieF
VSDEIKNSDILKRATYASVATAVLLIIIKIIAFFITNSVALLSSLVDSSLDLIASLIILYAVAHSLRPADKEHRFGHGKAEPLAGLAQSAFITGSSLYLCFEAVNRLFFPVVVEKGAVGIIVMLVSTVLSMALVAYQRYIIKRTGSLAIKADSLHYMNDIAINIGVVVALILSSYLGWLYADPIIAVFIAVVIMYSVWKIAKQSLTQLMDTELPDHEREKIKAIAMKYPEVHGIHDLRTRASGQLRFIQAHLELDGEITLNEAHRIADRVEQDIRDAFPKADVIIHQDPEDQY